MIGTLVILAVIFFGALFVLLRARRDKPWAVEYFRYKLTHPRLRAAGEEPIHIMFIYVDHFEPKENMREVEVQRDRIQSWVEGYRAMASRHHDADGVHPQHSWFYLVEELETLEHDREFLQQLAGLTYEGFGEVELHVHHGPGWHIFPEVDTVEKLEAVIERLKDIYHETGALITAEPQPRNLYGFIHGKWALDNSCYGLYCGVNQELDILRRTGCYADFTMPSGHGSSQSRKINSIYYAPTLQRLNKGHDWGADVQVDGRVNSNAPALMIFQGMIEIYFRNLLNDLSVVEKSNLDAHDLPTPRRIDQWVRCNVHVKGQPKWVFVKVHTHGAREENFAVNFGASADVMHDYLESHYNDGRRFKLHYVSAREGYNIVKAAEAGKSGDPSAYRDFIIAPYANRKIKTNAFYELVSYDSRFVEIKVLGMRAHECFFEFKELPIRSMRMQGVNRFIIQKESTTMAKLQLWFGNHLELNVQTDLGYVTASWVGSEKVKISRNHQTDEVGVNGKSLIISLFE